MSSFFHFYSLPCSQASSISKEESGKSERDDDFFEPWSSKRTGILAKYTTSEKLSITTVSYNTSYNIVHTCICNFFTVIFIYTINRFTIIAKIIPAFKFYF